MRRLQFSCDLRLAARAAHTHANPCNNAQLEGLRHPRVGYTGKRRSMPLVFMMRLAISSIEDSLVSSTGIE